ncbi:efflux RND transporter periplasmic adaptor subunit [Methylobacterium oxalidis]|uniref:Hemolysin D n=1 Tax=Methylobacterium oxalidis TaxID=944322 RepID=A0A512JAE6_9HYPH|nr:efflux RND transporter periplasmic adaptor subunit [Methylobacterium oxalidis]GEP06921.1 hemolysin D [Methylobacterium oxalidis]GJE33114.1 Multidrug resistance protein MdtA [Methylobacterium oxalidis]GLS64410.1 hemolysin D [Methylobacterium oxalidis]
MTPSFDARPAVAALALTLALTPVQAGSEPGSGEGSRSPPVVSVVGAVKREIAETAIVTGTLVARDEVLIAPEVDGYRVTEVLAEEGARVERGQVLARLSRDLIERQIAQQQAVVAKAATAVPQARSGIEQAEAVEVEARLAFERARQLMQTGNTTAVVMEGRTAILRQAESRLASARNGVAAAEADLDQARAMLSELELRRARTEIRAPDAGIVSRRSARVGMTASASAEPLFRLIARGEIELEGEVTETVLPRLREGAPAFVELGGERVAGSVRAVYPEVDRTTRLGKVRVRLTPDPRLRIGTFVRGEVEITRAAGVVIPLASIRYGGSARGTVLVVTGDTVEACEVRTGLAEDETVEIRSGLGEGEQVIAKAQSFLRNGDRVRVTAASQPAPTGAPQLPKAGWEAAAGTP